jgi:mannosyltransferase
VDWLSPAATPSREGWARRAGAIPSGLVAVALGVGTALLGFSGLGGRSIWADEAVSISYALEPVRGLVRSVSHDPNMSLYYGALWVWEHVFGDSLFAIRSLSVLFAALAVVAVYAVGARLFGRGAGVIAALLLATNAFFLTYAQEARGYSLVALLTTTATYFFVEALDGRRRALIAYVVVSALAFYAHFFSVFVTLGQAGIVIARRDPTVDRRRWATAYAAIAAFVAPVVYRSLTLGENPISWIPRPGAHALWVAVRSLAGESTLSVIAIALIVAVRLPTLLGKAFRRRFLLVLTWACLPLLVSFTVSQAHPLFLPRYLIVSVPALALLAAAAISALQPRVAAASLAAVVACAVPGLWRWNDRPAVEDWQRAAAFLSARVEPNDGAAYEMSWAIPAISYYLGDAQNPVRLRWGSADDVLPKPVGPRVWLFVYRDEGSPPGDPVGPLQRALRMRGLHEVAASAFRPDFEIELFTRAP